MNRTWSKLGGQLGLGCIAIGILVIALAWNGAAGVDFVQGQVPYLLSGGALGVSLCIVGGVLIVVQNNRRDRALLEAQLTDLNNAVTRLANAIGSGGLAAGNGHATSGATDRVALGRSSFHRLDCRLAEGKDLPVTTVEAALEEGLSPCRICNPVEVETAQN
jgi:hypothetical protein